MSADEVLEAMARAFAAASPCEMTKAEAVSATRAAIRVLAEGWCVTQVPEDMPARALEPSFGGGFNAALSMVRAAAVVVEPTP